MSHNIKYFEYAEDVNRKKAEADINRYVAHEDYQEGCSGLNSPIRWIESCGVFANYDEALAFIRSNDKGWYDSLAVRYREFNCQETPALQKARAKLKDVFEKYKALNNKFHFAESKSTYIGCRECGSKISHKHLKGNECPVCGEDLRPQSTKDIIEKFKDKVDKARSIVDEEINKSVSKHSKVKWLVKIEYHT